MRMIALIARGGLIYQDQPIAAGQYFLAAPIDAAVLRYRREVDFAPRGARPTPPPPTPALAQEASTPAVRQHSHDKQERATAEPPALLIPDRIPDEDIEDPPADDEKPRKRRQYRRRDLTAEE